MVEQSWHSIFVPLTDAGQVAEALRGVLNNAGYRTYDPFPGGTGLSFGWKKRIRHFVAPPAGGWIRILGEPDPEVLPSLPASIDSPLLHVWMDGKTGGLEVWTADGLDESPQALVRWLKEGRTASDLARALTGHMPVPLVDQDSPAVLAVPLPGDMRQMAEAVDPAEAEKLMNKLSKSVFGKLGEQGKEAQSQAQAMLQGGTLLWNTDPGQRIRGVMSCLSIPDGWRIPAYPDISEAFQVARSRQVNPDGLRLPGDDKSLALVPDALEYIPVFAGMR